jgi:hypothetical protein
MNRPAVRFSRIARDDVRAATDWYDGIRPGLGAAFMLALEASLQRVRCTTTATRQGQAVESSRVVLRRFPYAVHYRIGRGTLDVVGVLPLLIEPNSPRRHLVHD